MKVRSKLADMEFVVGGFEYRKDHLVVISAAGQAIAARVYVSPDDILTALGRLFTSPIALGYLLAFPFFLLRYRRRKANAASTTD